MTHTDNGSQISSDYTDPPEDVSSTKSNQQQAYSIYSPSQINTIMLLALLAGLISPLSAFTYFPALNAIQQDFGVSSVLVNFTVTVFMIVQGIAPSFWGALADHWGRRPVYLATMIIYVGACSGLAFTTTFPVFLVMRGVQAFGSSSVVAIGAGVIADITLPSNRGSFYGLYTMTRTAAPSFGPVLGGVIADRLSWRWIFIVLVVFGSTSFIAVFFLLPETLRSLVGNGSGYANPTPSQWFRRHILKDKSKPVYVPTRERYRQVPNFFASFRYLLELDVALAALCFGCQYTALYCLLTTFPSLLETYYNLNQLEIGLCFLAQGLGGIMGSVLEGHLLNRDFRIAARKHGLSETAMPGPDFPIFHARLRSAWIKVGLIQVSIFSYGWCFEYHTHLSVILVLHTIVGYCNCALSNDFQTLLVDLYPGKGASITATNNFVRCSMGAVAAVVIELGVQKLNVGWTFTIAGFVFVLSNALLAILLKRGPQWRKRRLEKDLAKQQETRC